MKFVPLLSSVGLCVLLDVTTKAEHTTFNPILMNRQVNQALRELNAYRTLLPLSCNKFERKCTEQCFTQQKFSVTHVKQTKDNSKVAYRVIAPEILAGKIIGHIKKNKYIIHKSKFQNTIDDGLCKYSIQQDIITDAYKFE
jgi:hypothetical protein